MIISKLAFLATTVALVATAAACTQGTNTSAEDEAEGNVSLAPRHCGGIAGLTCRSGEYCEYDLEETCGAADHLGTCQKTPDVCTREIDPVCGCDGKTYSNACNARAAGVSLLKKAACDDEVKPPPGPRACGSRGMAPCAEGEYCRYEAAASCGATDAPGTCDTRPEACIAQFDPVCGCDGKTYSNSCVAARAGASVAETGACK